MQNQYKPLILTKRQLAYVLTLLKVTSSTVPEHAEVRDKIENLLYPKSH